MKCKFLFLFVLICFSTTLHAQNIATKKVLGGYKFSQDGRLLNMKNLERIVSSNKESMYYIPAAKTNKTIANILGLAGGFLVGFDLANLLSGKETNGVGTGIGALLVGVSIPFSSAAGKNAKEAVDLYNESLESTTSDHSKTEWSIVAGSSGLGLYIRF